MKNERIEKIKNRNCFNKIITDDFNKTNNDYNDNIKQIIYPAGNNFKLVSNIFKTSTGIEYCLDISYIFLNQRMEIIEGLKIPKIFTFEHINSKSGVFVCYEINLNTIDFINSNNSITNINDSIELINPNEKSEIMQNINIIVNNYINQFPNRKIFGINLQDAEEYLPNYSKAFRKIFPSTFFKFNLKNAIIFVHESILDDEFKIEYNN